MFPRLCLAFALAGAGAALAQRPSGAPVLDPPAPTGGQRGTAVDITLSGTDLTDPLACWLGARAHVTFAPTDTTGKDSTKIRARVELPADMPVGPHRLRVATAGGMANFRPFCVDGLPEQVESDAGHTPATARPVPVPCVISGRIDAETSNFYRITVATGQRVSFEVLGRRLGSPLDPLLRLHDGTGRELPRAYSDDAPGLQTDARLSYVFAAPGDYLVEVRDTTHKGGKDFRYRLRMGDFPCAVTPLPLAAKRGTKVTVNFAGPQVEGVTPVEMQVPADPAVEAVNVTPVGPSGLPGWPVTLLVRDHDELSTGPAIGTLQQAQRVAPPCGVTGRFLHKSQKDHFVVAMKKGQRLLVAAQTAELHSPCEVYVTVRDGGNAELAKTDPQRDPFIDFTAPADGDFFVVAEHLNYSFGPTEVYRLTVAPPAPGMELTLGTDRVAVPQGQVGLVPVATLARRDYGGPVEVSVVGPPGLTGTVTIPPGVQAPPPAPGQPAPPSVAQLPVHAAADLAPGVYEITVRAKGAVDGKELIAFASTKAAVQAQLGGLPYPPRPWLRSVGVAVTPKPPFTLVARWERPDAVRGLTGKLIVTATRESGFDGDINVAAAGLPPGATASTGTVRAGQADTTIDVKLTDKAALGTFAFSVTGRGTLAGREVAATVLPPPLVVALPFELKVEPTQVPLDQGAKAELKVTAIRKGGYGGPIGLELRNLPAQVSANRATISAGKTEGALTLTAAADAPLASRGDVDVLGTAPLGNQQMASPPFTVRVQAPPAVLTMKVEPAAVTLKSGDKARLKVTVERKHFAGPVAVTVEGLPTRVTAAAVTIAAEQSAAEVELTAAADAESAKAEATVTGKAAASASAKLSVQVEK